MEGYDHSSTTSLRLTNMSQMGPPPNPDAMLEMMDNPMFLSQMNEAMNNPAVVDMMMQSPMVGRFVHARCTSLLTCDRSATTPCSNRCSRTRRCAE
jgi:hypothetical protein